MISLRGRSKENTIFRNYTTDPLPLERQPELQETIIRKVRIITKLLPLCTFVSFLVQDSVCYRISANEFSSAPRFGVGIAPTSLATQAPTRFATSFMRSSEAPCRYSWTSPAVNASPEPTVSATSTLNPGCSLEHFLLTRRLPLPPRVMEINSNSYSSIRRRAEDNSSLWGRRFKLMIFGSSSLLSFTMSAILIESAKISGE